MGDKIGYLNKAVVALQRLPLQVVAQSKYYRTEPIGYRDQDSFINIALMIQSDLSAADVIDHINHIEQQLDRKRIIRWGPRTIDIDIIWINGESYDDDRLIVPHPRAMERAFVVKPMLDLPIDDQQLYKQLQIALDAVSEQIVVEHNPNVKALNPSHRTTITVGSKIIGADSPIIIAGPCSVESEEQIDLMAKTMASYGVDILRGGVFKPRTSPYDFQGLGFEGLGYLKNASLKYGIPFVTEVMDVSTLERVAEMADIIQIGARNMYNYPLLKAVGTLKKPVLLKRGLSATIKEWVLAAEYIASMGNDQIILCERGIRSFDNYTRNTLDLAAIPIMQAETGLPVIADPSHGTGLRELIAPMSHAAIAAGADGLMIEVHHDPDRALSDGPQSIRLETLKALLAQLNDISQCFTKKK